MPVRDPNVAAAPLVTLEKGMSSGLDPRLVALNQAALLINCTVRDGFPRNRPGWKQVALSYEDQDQQDFVEDGYFQGATFFAPRQSIPMLCASISGRQFRFNVWGGNTVQEITISNNNILDPNPSNLLQVWWTQAEDWLLLQDGSSKPWIYDGGQARRAGVREIPTGCMMVYALGRVWVVYPDRLSFGAGDLVGSSSGTAAYGYRDAVLKWTENDFLITSGSFAVPLNAGQINAVTATANLDSSLGQGPIEFFTDNGAFSVQAPFDRETWKDLRYPIQTVSLAAPGSLSQASTIIINGDIWYRGLDGIRSFIIARRDFGLWGNVPLSEEMERLLDYDALWLLPWSSAALFDNRLLMTATPRWDADHGVSHDALAVINFDAISALGQRSPPCWEGMWTGKRILKVVKGSHQKTERLFAFVLNSSSRIELWELDPEASFDYPSSGSKQRIKWGLETRLNDYGRPDSIKELEGADLAVAEIQGTVDVSTRYRSDDAPCWQDWSVFQLCARDSKCPPDACLTLTQYQKSYRSRITLPRPATVCETSPNKPAPVGFRHQLRLEFTGASTLKQLVPKARLLPEQPFDGCPPATAVCTEDTCCALDNYLQSVV